MVIFGVTDSLVYVFVVAIALGNYSFMTVLLVSVAPNLLLLLGISINGWRCVGVLESSTYRELDGLA